MINNRQAGRRRGRGGQRSGGNPGRPESGNRIDNRARGNAAQLLEKYKNLARDAQTSGDRVMTEYYLQFADHYFRVLSDSRSRFEENRRQREDAEDEGDEEFGYEGEQGSPAGYGMQDEPRDREPRDREPRRDSREQGEGRREPRDYGEGRGPRRNEARQRDDRDRGERGDRRERMEPRANGRALDLDDPVGGMDAPAPAPSAPIAANDAPRRRGRPRRDAAAEQDGSGALDAAVLPPAIGAAPAAEAAGDDAPRPVRRRRVRSDDEAVPPAA